MENYFVEHIQLELPDYSQEYEEYLRKKKEKDQNQEKEDENIIIIDLF